MVWTAGPSRHGGVGRWHAQSDCGFMLGPKLLRERPQAEAEALGFWACPYCCPLPACCQADDHSGLTRMVAPVPLVPSDLPEWERELLAAEGAVEGEA